MPAGPPDVAGVPRGIDPADDACVDARGPCPSNPGMSDPPTHPTHPTVSVIVAWPPPSAGSEAAATACVRTALDQDYDAIELILVGHGDEPGAAMETAPPPAPLRPIRRIAGSFPSRAAALNAALAGAGGGFVLILRTDLGALTLRRSAVTAFVAAARRHPRAGMIYADYERCDPEGTRRQVHLSPYHAGRLRETTDFGAAALYRLDAIRSVGSFDERLTVAEHYDLRLRLSQAHRLIHVAGGRDGALYSVAGHPPDAGVFDYLLDDRAKRREMETVVTDHLRRIGAYLPPGLNITAVPRSAGDEPELAASVVIPVNVRPGFIARAIESVQSQTVPDVEAIVVVNGGPCDPTIPVIRRYLPGGDRYDPARPRIRLRVLDINNIGLSLNAGLAAARGRYYVQLDSDDRLKPDAVERLLAVFESDPTVGMVIGSYEVWDRDEATGRITPNATVPIVTHEEWTADNGRNNLLRVNGAGAPRAAPIDLIRRLGGFGCNDTPHSRNYGEDYDLVLRISERYTIGRVWEPIYEVVRHAGGTDHAVDEATAARNHDAKDEMRREAILRRQAINRRLGRRPAPTSGRRGEPPNSFGGRAAGRRPNRSGTLAPDAQEAQGIEGDEHGAAFMTDDRQRQGDAAGHGEPGQHDDDADGQD